MGEIENVIAKARRAHEPNLGGEGHCSCGWWHGFELVCFDEHVTAAIADALRSAVSLGLLEELGGKQDGEHAKFVLRDTFYTTRLASQRDIEEAEADEFFDSRWPVFAFPSLDPGVSR